MQGPPQLKPRLGVGEGKVTITSISSLGVKAWPHPTSRGARDQRLARDQGGGEDGSGWATSRLCRGTTPTKQMTLLDNVRE